MISIEKKRKTKREVGSNWLAGEKIGATDIGWTIHIFVMWSATKEYEKKTIQIERMKGRKSWKTKL